MHANDKAQQHLYAASELFTNLYNGHVPYDEEKKQMVHAMISLTEGLLAINEQLVKLHDISPD